MKSVQEIIKQGLIVSCQALDHEPLHSSFIMSKMALAAAQGGAVGIRANTGKDIVAIKKEVNLPIIGIVKKDYNDSPIYITPTLEEVHEIAVAGAEIVAIDATHRIRPKGEKLENLVAKIKATYPNLKLMADISTYEEGLHASEIGFDIVSTTLCGYTEGTKKCQLPNIDLVEKLSRNLQIPVIAEGGISHQDEVVQVLSKGAYAVVVGTAITRPREITQKFVQSIKEM